MPISTNKNTSYGPPLVTDKYRPLLNIMLDKNDSSLYSGLLLKRWTLMNDAGLLPKTLGLVMPNWATAAASEAGLNPPLPPVVKKPPLVVVSSNRSGWIKSGIDAADAQPGHLKPFDNAYDLRALTGVSGQAVSPPIYCPSRIGADGPRNVYVVVHAAEYATYKENLAGTGITVVGWRFRDPAGDAPVNICGFGASRFAAIQFCKELRTAATVGGVAPWDYAWLIDDNVVALTSFPGYSAVEAAMTEAHVCAGLQGGTKAETVLTNRTWAVKEVSQGRGGQEGKGNANKKVTLPASVLPGIIQQTSLWNIAYLTTNHLNFGPAYVASAEDLSIGKYFDMKKIPYLHYGGIGVRKEETTYDDSKGSRWVKQARDKFAKWFADMESAVPVAEPLPPPPPPIYVKPLDAEDGGVQTLSDFIVNRVLPNSAMRDDASKAAVQNNAKCQSVELITCEAIEAGYVSDTALNNTFKFNDTNAQAVMRRDMP